jgi:hypothetical protein
LALTRVTLLVTSLPPLHSIAVGDRDIASIDQVDRAAFALTVVPDDIVAGGNDAVPDVDRTVICCFR